MISITSDVFILLISLFLYKSHDETVVFLELPIGANLW